MEPKDILRIKTIRDAQDIIMEKIKTATQENQASR